uniref:Uncharacterized protein n=1 Tax=Trichuris muris TaxID=70415 RepID=A0A5S6QVU8_TRIMR
MEISELQNGTLRCRLRRALRKETKDRPTDTADRRTRIRVACSVASIETSMVVAVIESIGRVGPNPARRKCQFREEEEEETDRTGW